MLNLNKSTKTKPKPKPTLIFKNCSYVWVSLCTHNTRQNSSDNFPSYPPDNHHSSDGIYCRWGAFADKQRKCLRSRDDVYQSKRVVIYRTNWRHGRRTFMSFLYALSPKCPHLRIHFWRTTHLKWAAWITFVHRILTKYDISSYEKYQCTTL